MTWVSAERVGPAVGLFRPELLSTQCYFCVFACLIFGVVCWSDREMKRLGMAAKKTSKLRGQISEEPRKSLDRWPGTIMRITRNHCIK
jgi:hypothetical protein